MKINFTGREIVVKQVQAYVGRSISHTPGSVIHEWHGSRKDRGYTTRYDLVKDVCLDTDVELRDGLLHWTSSADPTAKEAVVGYFISRKSDD